MLFLLSVIGLASANDILIPHISAVELDDFSVASQIEEELVMGLEGLGLSVVAPRVLDQEYPELSASCYELEECSNTLLARDNATLLLVGSVESTATDYNLQFRFYGRTSSSPLDVQTISIPQAELSSTIQKI